MRTIKFRAKKKSGEWVYGSLLTWPDGKAMIYDTLLADGSMGGHEVKPETIGQLTCLRDINGKEIYEGDILDVSYADEDSYLEVRFVRGVFAFLWNGDLDDEFPCNAPTHEWAKVIGNIHDDPKLLKRH
jgi:hypothetical protein